MKYLIIGNGVAGTTAASHIRKLDNNGEIRMLTDEDVPFYSRIRLIDYLARAATLQDIIIYKEAWYEKNDIMLRTSTSIREIDSANKYVRTNNGDTFEYDKLLLATGGLSFMPPIKGSDLNGVFTLRSVADADRIIAYSKNKKNVVLIGGGVLGLEAGNSLKKSGHSVTVVEFFPRLLPRQMDPDGAEILKRQMENMGFTFYLDAKSKEILGNNAVQSLILESGSTIDCDLIIVSAGIRPRAELATGLGLAVNKGVVVNDRMETAISDIYAAGDVIEHKDTFYGIWPAAQKQGEIAGINMAGGEARYQGTTVSNVLKVVGIDLAAAGEIDAEGQHESLVYKDDEKYIYKKLVFRNDALAGCVFYGDISDYQKVFKAISEQRNLRKKRKEIEKWDLSGL